MLVCKICEKDFPDGVPSHAVLLNSSGGMNVYQWDDVVHLLYEKRSNLKVTHREHKLVKAKDCPLCFPPPPKPDLPAPVVEVEQLPEPIVEVTTTELETTEDTEVVPLTSMAAAFRRMKS